MTFSLSAPHGWMAAAILLCSLILSGCPPHKPEPIISAVDGAPSHHRSPG